MEDFKYTGTRELETVSDNAQWYNNHLLSLILKHAPKEGKVLDIGAGLGYYADKLKMRGYNVACMELDEEHCKRMEEIGLTVARSVDEIEDESLDFIYSINVLEHIEEDDEALKVWARKLKPGGGVFIWVPSFMVLYSSFDKLIGHFRRYRKKTLVEKMKMAGFSVKKAKYSDSMGFFVALLHKWIKGNRERGKGNISKIEVMIFDKIIFPVNRITDSFFSNTLGKNIWVFAVK
jgi:2-polyprenyl-3-methyl-5-hydroxy-6-metoxy-1,4-benzoquinol methylase